MRRHLLQALVALPLAVSLGGCYYGHLLMGQADILRARTPIAEVIADEQADPELRRRLEMVQEARRFAVERLGLPDSGSYKSYVALDRPFALWNVFVTEEFSLAAEEWCAPLYGCFAYRGFYDEARARDYAARLSRQGMDVHVAGVSAYSTLGWFRDPVLSSMMRWDDAVLVATIFHELAHEQYYLRGDTAFNESYATFVEEEGLRQWALSRGESLPEAVQQRRRRQEDFVALITTARERLKALYAEELDAETMRSRKADAFAQLREDYRALRDSAWDGWSGYDQWFDSYLNNAKLLPVGLYHQWVPAFESLFIEVGGEWADFHEEVSRIGAMEAPEREAWLQERMP